MSDWPRHKIQCRSFRAIAADLEVHALADPHEQLLDSAFLSHFTLDFIRLAVMPALANAFKLHRKPYLNTTHGLHLSFNFDPKKSALAEQFVLSKGKINFTAYNCNEHLFGSASNSSRGRHPR